MANYVSVLGSDRRNASSPCPSFVVVTSPCRQTRRCRSSSCFLVVQLVVPPRRRVIY
ncbi:hypothetical protein PanWU01x14_053700, partial [Parasponia andersonii]